MRPNFTVKLNVGCWQFLCWEFTQKMTRNMFKVYTDHEKASTTFVLTQLRV